MSVDCKKCGHYSLIMSDDSKVLRGCAAAGLVFEEHYDHLKTAAFSEVDKTTSFEFVPIDSTFMLNKNDDCFMWVEQTVDQKKKLKGIKKMLEGGLFDKLSDLLS